MNLLPENSLRIYDVTLVTSYLIGLDRGRFVIALLIGDSHSATIKISGLESESSNKKIFMNYDYKYL